MILTCPYCTYTIIYIYLMATGQDLLNEKMERNQNKFKKKKKGNISSGVRVGVNR